MLSHYFGTSIEKKHLLSLNGHFFLENTITVNLSESLS